MNSNLKYLIKACEKKNIPFKFLDKEKNFLEIEINNKFFHFIHFGTPLNSHSVHLINLDKEFTYLLLKDFIRMPKTIGYLDPKVKKKYQRYLNFDSVDAIAKDIQKNFNFPLVLKRNRGHRTKNVFLVKNSLEIKNVLKEIFEKKVWDYDYVAIAQEKVDIKKELRVIILNKKVVLVYDKNTAKFNRSSKYKKSNHEIITNKDFLRNLEKFIKPIYKKLDLNFAGLDILVDKEDKFWLLEINNNPGFYAFTKDNSIQEVINLYEKIIDYLKTN